MRLLLIRHGQTPSNVLGLLDTAPPGPGLTDLGHAQAKALPDSLADHRIDVIAASTQPRSQLTAAPLAAARGLEVLIRDGLCEVPAGDLEMRGDEDAVRTYLGTVRRWMDGELDVAMPGGQTGTQVVARFDAVVAELTELVAERAGDDGVVTLVAHGAVLRTWATVRGADAAVRRELFERFHPLHNTGLIVLNSRPDGGWLMESWAGRALVGAGLDDGAADGPAGEDPTGSDPTAGTGIGGDPTAGRPDPTGVGSGPGRADGTAGRLGR
jgi:probable phosphoglycerate mutase